LIELARRDAPGADFDVQDARTLALRQRYNAAVSTFDSLNHILTLGELQRVFENVFRVLNRDGLFVFDMNLLEAYSADLRQWAVDVTDQTVGMVRGTFDVASSTATTQLIWFMRQADANAWTRHDALVYERCYSQAEIVAALEAAGFGSIECLSAAEAGVTAELGFGRIFVSARA
jgi:ubiquinone/menaquinone biosynthesis C-methylase UbiE